MSGFLYTHIYIYIYNTMFQDPFIPSIFCSPLSFLSLHKKENKNKKRFFNLGLLQLLLFFYPRELETVSFQHIKQPQFYSLAEIFIKNFNPNDKIPPIFPHLLCNQVKILDFQSKIILLHCQKIICEILVTFILLQYKYFDRNTLPIFLTRAKFLLLEK